MQGKPRTYQEAREKCITKGAIIAVPNSPEENKFLASITRQPITWIGFDYTDSELWADGTSSSATSSWRVLYEVDDSGDRANGEPAVFIRPNGDWSFDAKSLSHQAICEKAPGALRL